MNAKLFQVLHTIERERLRILMPLENFDEHKFMHSPSSAKWPIAQILTHLLTSERMSLLYMKKKYRGVSTLDDSGIIESLKTSLLKVSQRIPLRYKAPGVVLQQTPSALPFTTLKENWNESREELREFLESIPDEYLYRKIYKHPVVGRLNVMQAVDFYGEHIRHHWPQIKRLL